MKDLVDKIIECNLDNIPFAEFQKNKRFGLVVYKNDVKYEFLIHFKTTSENLICLGSGALNGVDLERFKQKPRFHRQSWAFHESTIFYNDPTRYLNNSILGGWGVGTPDDWYLENIKEIILKISQHFKIKNENILFYGSSLGGFMSIQLGTLVKKSKVLADVPQLTFENAKYFQRIKHVLFPGYTDDEIKTHFNYRLNVLDLIKKEKYIPNAILIFDGGNRDISEHYTPFFQELNKITECGNTNRIKIIINPINEHKFLSMDESLEIIQQACDNNLMCFGSEIYASEIYKNLKDSENKYQKEIFEKNQQIAYLNEQNKELEIKLNKILNSTTWKMTKPLRKSLDYLKNE